MSGMNLISADLRIPGTSIPRVSGDEPRRAASSFAHASYSPRERGEPKLSPIDVITPSYSPRERGEPGISREHAHRGLYSPHVRG